MKYKILEKLAESDKPEPLMENLQLEDEDWVLAVTNYWIFGHFKVGAFVRVPIEYEVPEGWQERTDLDEKIMIWPINPETGRGPVIPTLGPGLAWFY